jgi:electron transfer flavoprotein beta subunit
MGAKKKEIRKVHSETAAAPKQKIVGLYLPEKTKRTHLIPGSPHEAAKELVRMLREEARVIP